MIRFILPVAIAGMSVAAVAMTAQDHGQTCSSSSKAALGSGEKNIVETAVGAGQFNTLAAALEAAGLALALQAKGPFTVFAPTDEAFAQIPEKTLQSLLKPENKAALTRILTHHVVPGRVAAADVIKLKNADALNGQRLPIHATDAGVTVAGSRVVKTDIHCSNGIIHVIDSVMMPATLDIIETATKAGSFNTLAAALKAGGLIEALQGEGPFTVFAPTDGAFAALAEGTVESLLEPQNKHKLVAILEYHVVQGRVYSDQLENGGVPTLQGSNIHVELSDRGAFINQSRVTTADIQTTNGVIHVIDKVLLPE